jgi:hypothetical protein
MTEEKAQTSEEEFISEVGVKLDACGIKIIHEVDALYALLAARFPMETGRIDWPLVPATTESSVLSVSSFYGIDRVTACKRFLSEQILFYEISGPAYFANDSLDIVLAGDVASFEQIFKHLLWPPGHIYLYSEKGTWCLNVTFEDDLYFGFAPPKVLSS